MKQTACLEESHMDDVTQVHFVPNNQSKLVSGSVDGIKDTSMETLVRVDSAKGIRSQRSHENEDHSRQRRHLHHGPDFGHCKNSSVQFVGKSSSRMINSFVETYAYTSANKAFVFGFRNHSSNSFMDHDSWWNIVKSVLA